MVISHRGSPGEKIGAQVPMSLATKPVLETIGVPTFGFGNSAEIPQIANLLHYAQTAQRPVAALLDFNFWSS